MKPLFPRFRLLEPVYTRPARHAAASKFGAGAEIDLELDAVPSFGMVPLNAPACAATAAMIRKRGLRRLSNPAAGDRGMLLALTTATGGRTGTVAEMAAHVEHWLSTQEPKS